MCFLCTVFDGGVKTRHSRLQTLASDSVGSDTNGAFFLPPQIRPKGVCLIVSSGTINSGGGTKTSRMSVSFLIVVVFFLSTSLALREPT